MQAALSPDRRRKRCGACGAVGHSKLECPEGDGGGRRGTVTCSQCLQPGHNSRKCPMVPRNTSVTCSICNQVGHNCRTCPRRSSRKAAKVRARAPACSPARPRRSTCRPGAMKPIAALWHALHHPAVTLDTCVLRAPRAPSWPLLLQVDSLARKRSSPPKTPQSASAGESGPQNSPTSVCTVSPAATRGEQDGTSEPLAAPRDGSELFGAGPAMPLISEHPLHAGPLPPDFTFGLPDSVEGAVQLACAASYRCALRRCGFGHTSLLEQCRRTMFGLNTSRLGLRIALLVVRACVCMEQYSIPT